MENEEVLKQEELLASNGARAALNQTMFSTRETFEINDPRAKKRGGMNCMVPVVIYLILLTAGIGLVIMKVLNLQERLRHLESYYDNETLLVEESPSSSFLQLMPGPSPVRGATKLQVLQAQFIQVYSRQEHLQRWVDNFTQNPGYVLSSFPGLSGPRGPPGIKGEAGRKGDPGMKGDMGVMGPPGAQGEKGDSGRPGFPGVAGIPGIKGNQGPPGAAGSPGAKGEPGSAGPTGPIGPPGRPGSPGAEGMKGSKGETGLQGQKGTKGDSGVPGLVGAKGEKGSPGLVGLRGEPGPAGQKGQPGAKGSSGLQGEKGQKGQKGESLMSVRIIGSSNRGRAEIFYNGAWGTICDDGWDNSDATVFCRMMGYSSGRAISGVAAGSGTIWLDDVACRGSESTLWNCNKNNWGSHNCNHNEDAGVDCS
uniref:Macrophage receptor MARCO n=1 Tax=Camelus bactrianus TaxID=9837 RepID=A0A9W3EPH1_CAMBA|nr:macrophage receptor MARCO [Camelus bactrianus]